MVVYLAEGGGFRVRKLNLITQLTNLVAGDGNAGTTGDGGAATSARFVSIYGVCVTGAGAVTISDLSANRVRRVDTSGVVNVLAGTGQQSTLTTDANGDGDKATVATLSSPCLIALDSSGHLFIADIDNNKVRRVDKTTTIITTVGGTGMAGSSVDGGFATATVLSAPFGVFVDSVGKLFLSEYTGKRIRVIGTDNIATVVAGEIIFFCTYK